MRKIISILLVTAFIIGIFSVNGIGVSASTDILTLNKSHTITVSAEEETVLEFTPSKTGYYSLTSFSNDDVYCTIYDSFEEIAYNDDGGEGRDFCVKAKLEAGVTYTYGIGVFSGKTDNVEVKLQEAPYVTDIEVVKEPYNTTYFNYYIEDYFNIYGAELKLTLSDGSECLWDCYDEKFSMQTDTSETYKTGSVSLNIEEATCELPLNLLNKKVKSLEVIDDNFNPLEEEVHGAWTYDENDNEFFYYYSDYSELGLKIKYSDGSYDILNSIADPLNDMYYAYVEDDQFEKAWSVGGNKNTLTIEFLGATVNYNVKIVENPVKSITINTPPTKQYTFGDVDCGEYFYDEYYLFPEDLTGIEFTVNFKDGTKQRCTYSDVDFNNGTIAGYTYYLDYDYFSSGNNIPVILNYRGCAAQYSVKVNDIGVSKVEIVKAPTITAFQNYDFGVDYIGAQFKITYTNGRSKTVTVTESNSQYVYSSYYGEVGVDVIVDGYKARFTTEYDTDCITNLAYMGATCTKENLITYKENYIKEIAVKNFKTDGTMTLDLTFEDNFKTTINIAPRTKNVENLGDYTENMCTATTELGQIIYSYYMYNKNPGVFELEILNKYFTFDFTSNSVKGDFDFSGKADLMDVVMLAQYVAGWDVAGDSSTMNVNGDEVTDLLDVVHMARYVANWQGIELK